VAESWFRAKRKRGYVDDKTIFNITINININNNVEVVVVELAVAAAAAAAETEIELITIIDIVIVIVISSSSNNLVIINKNIIEAQIIEIDDNGDFIYMYQNNEKNNDIFFV